MFRFLYYKGYIDILEVDMLLELRKDIEKDYKEKIIEKHQYKYLIEHIDKKLNTYKIACI